VNPERINQDEVARSTGDEPKTKKGVRRGKTSVDRVGGSSSQIIKQGSVICICVRSRRRKEAHPQKGLVEKRGAFKVESGVTERPRKSVSEK